MGKKNHTQIVEKSRRKQRQLADYAEKLARVPREETRLSQENNAIKYFPGTCKKKSCGKEAACMPYNSTMHYCRCPSNGMPVSEGFQCPRNTAKYFLGTCEKNSCGTEAACMPYNSTMHFCRCTSNGMPVTEGYQCPRSTVKYFMGTCKKNSCGKEAACMPYNSTMHYCRCTSNGMPVSEGFQCPRSTVTVTPKPIYNIIPPQTRTNNATERHAPTPPTVQVSRAQVGGEDYSEAPTSVDLAAVTGTGVNASTGVLLVVLASGAVIVLFVILLVAWYLRRRMCQEDGKSQPRVRPGEPLLAERYITNPQYGVYGANTPDTTGGTAMAVTADGNAEPRVPHLDRHALTFLEEVGEGCFGKVHKGLLRTSAEEIVVAIKVLKESAGRSAEEDFVREVSIMSAFRHPNILTLVGVVYKDDINSSPWMVFEYMEWGDLAGVLRGSRGGGRPGPTLDDPALLHVGLQVARGMQYLASRRFVHRDLAARNCLVGAHLTVKIADFGMSRDVYTCDYYKMGGERPMPVRWMSPESIVYARFTHESDVWSYGVVLWEIYSRGKQPFYGHNNDGATKLILQGIVLVPPEDCPRFACDLMRECWKTDPRDRINFDEICRKLEVAAAGGAPSVQLRLPLPPNPAQDSAGYLIPARQPPADYLTLSLEDNEPEADSDSSEEEDDEYT